MLFGDPTENEGGTQLPVAVNSDAEDSGSSPSTRRRENTTQSLCDQHGGRIPLADAFLPKLATRSNPGISLQTRSWHEIEFRNISLHRGQKTNFAIFIDGKPYAEPTNTTRSEAIDALPKTDVGIGRSRAQNAIQPPQFGARAPCRSSDSLRCP